MSYKVLDSQKAQTDIISTYRYISVTLQNQKAADDLLVKITDTVTSLSTYPERFSLVSDPVLGSRGIRIVTINNYTLFYVVNKKEKRIYVVRFLYSKRNWASILAL